ncbi:MAG: RsiV family protein [Eubacteriaceae bacterium]|nr:RsiV family protein [Eubacteriaceae bacterium]
MKDFDEYMRGMISEDQWEIPESVKDEIELSLEALPEETGNIRPFHRLPRMIAVAASILFITLGVFPNISQSYAQALEQLPLVGDMVKVVTIRNYIFSDDEYDMMVDVPMLENSSKEAEYINKDVSELTTELVNKFYEEVKLYGNSGYGSIDVKYDTVTNSDRWFTLKLAVCETSASSNKYYKFYHIDKKQGKTVMLEDLFIDDSFSKIIADEIISQMRDQMKQNEGISYWIDDPEFSENFDSVGSEQNFYWNEDGNLVIIFDEYEVGPGSIGTPEFVIEKSKLSRILKDEYLTDDIV